MLSLSAKSLLRWQTPLIQRCSPISALTRSSSLSSSLPSTTTRINLFTQNVSSKRYFHPTPPNHQQHKESMDQLKDKFKKYLGGGGGGGLGGDDDNRKKYIMLLAALFGLGYFLYSYATPNDTIDFQSFKTQILPSRMVDRVQIFGTTMVQATMKAGYVPPAGLPIRSNNTYLFTIGDLALFERQFTDAQYDLGWDMFEHVPVVYADSASVSSALWQLGPMMLVLGFSVYFLYRMRSMGGGGGGGMGSLFTFGKTNARVQGVKITTKFTDVAGMDEAKQEILEFVSFLKNPEKYKRLGAKIPKGALLVGPPGTGKTLIARATAGEAGVPFFSISGSDFIEMFAGVGPARVRDLFTQARASAPCIIFIDEIDAVGRARSKNGFHNDERENTLNQLLVEMDGFDTGTGVVVLAGTNRPDVLDKALLRPGRFDRQIGIDKPDIKGRRDIFLVHLKNLKMQDNVDETAKRLSALTPGFSGADVANVCNEGALIAARRSKKLIETVDFIDAIERVIAGLEKKNRILSPEEKKRVAYHEAGHAIAGWYLEHADPLLKVSIIPRGIGALGYAQYQPKDQYLYTVEQLRDRMCVTLGGRVAEQLIFGKISTGARDDLEKITKLAYSQITTYGMNPRVGLLSFPQNDDEYGGSQPYSQATARMIDSEVRKMVSSAYDTTVTLLTEKLQDIEKVAQRLMEREVLSRDDMRELLGPRPFPEFTTYEQLTQQAIDDKKNAPPPPPPSTDVPSPAL